MIKKVKKTKNKKVANKFKANSLVQAWLFVELKEHGRTLAEALKDLNNKLDSAHTHSRVREWEDNRNGRGDRLPRKLRQYMLQKVLKSILANAGFDAKKMNSRQLKKLAEMLS